MPQNNEISILSLHISEKIAAGEVVDRPLSIAKELVENSIDAGANNIVTEIRDGGKAYIRVTDNGAGIPSKYVEMAFLRHATSKIRDIEDLDAIGTLGFRGEALASIAAVSNVEIITKTADEKAGIRMVIRGGEVMEISPTGCPDGTTIIITDLFYNTPARLKFMKTPGAESSLIVDFISRMALAYPDIRFMMINNGTPLFATRGDGSIYNSIITIYSKQAGNKLIEIDETEGDYGIKAYISPPDVTRGNKKGQVYFVNGRNVSDKVLESAVSEAYRELVDTGRNPYVYLFLQAPQNRIDVNIHPNKKEIRFDDNSQVSKFVINALRKGLYSKEGLSGIKINENPFRIMDRMGQVPEEPIPAGHDPLKKASDYYRQIEQVSEIPGWVNQASENHSRMEQAPEITGEVGPMAGITNKVGDATGITGKVGKVTEIQSEVDIRTLLVTERRDKLDREAPIESRSKTALSPLRIRDLRPLGSVFATYILAVDDDRLYLIDQHAAHERVLYEKFLKQFKKEEKDTQLLLSPILLETSPAVFNNAEALIDKLTQAGFEIEAFGLRTFIIKGIPSFMEYEGAQRFLSEFTEEYDMIKGIVDGDKLNKIITRACKGAIKANNLLNIDEIHYLLRELSETDNPLSCPHGRPTILMLSSKDIERMFKR